jgi:hypothetical protein
VKHGQSDLDKANILCLEEMRCIYYPFELSVYQCLFFTKQEGELPLLVMIYIKNKTKRVMYMNEPKERKKLKRAKKIKVNFLAILSWMIVSVHLLYV